jgi:hypothetical protein
LNNWKQRLERNASIKRTPTASASNPSIDDHTSTVP